jgi:hypothetical protein
MREGEDWSMRLCFERKSEKMTTMDTKRCGATEMNQVWWCVYPRNDTQCSI